MFVGVYCQEFGSRINVAKQLAGGDLGYDSIYHRWSDLLSWKVGVRENQAPQLIIVRPL
jgi:hypothetical protein